MRYVDNIVQPGRPQMTIWRMRIACWLLKATHTRYVIRIALPLQQWLHERAAMLRYTHIACLARINYDESKKHRNDRDKEGSTKIFCSQQTALSVETPQFKQASRGPLDT